jgi:hypothetical protein
MYREIATHVYRRAVESDPTALKLPGWAWAVVVLDLLVFMPIFIVIGYTLNNIYPVLAMVEDPSPPAYEPVSLNQDTDSLAEDISPLNDEIDGTNQARAISSSFRAVHRTIYAISGWRSYFRGFACWIALSVSSMFVYGIISTLPFVPKIVAAAISAVVLVQVYTAWTHIIISAPSPKRFYQRLPPFKKAFQATALPTIIYFIALEINSLAPKFLARVLGMTAWDPSQPGQIPQPSGSDSWKGLIIFIVSMVLTVFLTIPAHVVLARVQASLLPEEDETIVPFDRSFQGKLEPAIVGGRGYVTIKDAWQTFSRASWIRLVKLYVKIFAVVLAIYAAAMVVIVPEIFIILKNSEKIE